MIAYVFEIPDVVEAAGYSKATKARLDGSKLKKLGWKPRYDIKKTNIFHNLTSIITCFYSSCFLHITIRLNFLNIIVHFSDRMKSLFGQMNLNAQIVSLEIFDYLIPDYNKEKIKRRIMNFHPILIRNYRSCCMEFH